MGAHHLTDRQRAILEFIERSVRSRGYPPSVGTPRFRDAATGWVRRRFGVEVDPGSLAATIGSKELVAGLPHWLRLRTPERDTVLHPAIAYPTYAMGARLAGCRAVAASHQAGLLSGFYSDAHPGRRTGSQPSG